MKEVVVINGKAKVGKDLFVSYVSEEVGTINYSSVYELKKLATEYFGYNDKNKNAKDRKFLSNLKDLTTNYCNFCFNCVMSRYLEYKNDDNEIMFIHCREPEEIAKIKEAIPKSHTLLIVSDRDIEAVDNNHSDKDVLDYDYEFYINNSGTKEELKLKAVDFIKNLRLSNHE